MRMRKRKKTVFAVLLPPARLLHAREEDPASAMPTVMVLTHLKQSHSNTSPHTVQLIVINLILLSLF